MARLQLLTPEGVPYRPLQGQYTFHSSPSKFRAYIGGFGSGKSLCGAVEVLLTALKFPGSYGIVTRWSYRELEATSFKTLLDIIPPSMIERQYKNQLLVVLKNGSQIQGFNASNHKRLTSLNLDYFWVDEVTEIGEDLFLQLSGRLRGKAPRRGWVTGNPNGKDWVWKTFVDEQRNDYHFTHARTYENTHLPQDYVENLRKYYPAEWVQRFCEGSFDAFEGQVFNEFSSAQHVIHPSDVFPIPQEWPRFRGIDHGIFHPTCCLWAAMAPSDDLFIYDCYYERNKLVSDHAEAILQRTGNDLIDWTVIDPSTNRREALTGVTIKDEYRKLGINTVDGNNAILDGISRLKELLRSDPLHTHPVNGRTGSPHLHIFPQCKELIWEIGQYKWRDQRPGLAGKEREEPVDRHNHAVDAMRYIVMQNPRATIAGQDKGEWNRWQKLLEDLRGDENADDELRIGQWIKE